MWHNLVDTDMSYLEKAVRTVLVYVLVLVLLRLAGKRDLAQLNTFDLVVSLLLVTILQNAVIGPDESVAGGAFGALILILANGLMVRGTMMSDRFSRLVEGVPVTLVRDGTWLPKAISRNRLRRSDLEVAVRSQGGDGGAEASEVTLQPSGTLLVTLRKSDQAADKNDVAALSAELTALRAELATLRRELAARP
ncbi:DUF421 domain-containing protein [Streptomyces sp. NBC_01433]|uniref:DUF421 domain-containing protein n=1 Tax=Streptomyces sp. NBC_01433 TaxID=2903864 RepID=UPI002251A9FB|nr:YetF domain-containing protein [Streptomyces sp. NBC_01433]MCX4679440.1 DUF421 domain-containing protein [Streptomyces sp. NBC_01433]